MGAATTDRFPLYAVPILKPPAQKTRRGRERKDRGSSRRGKQGQAGQANVTSQGSRVENRLSEEGRKSNE